jgi:7,8-dihydro-6-hydroxymethylpterin-pyrophosphokinase
MWSLNSQRGTRTSGPKNFQSSAKKDFFNTIAQSGHTDYRASKVPEAIVPWIRARALLAKHIRRGPKNVDIDVLVFRDLQQLRGFLIDIREIVEHMKYLFELPETVIRP